MPVYINKMKPNLHFSWLLDFNLHNTFDVWLDFSENADVTSRFKIIWR